MTVTGAGAGAGAEVLELVETFSDALVSLSDDTSGYACEVLAFFFFLRRANKHEVFDIVSASIRKES